MGNSVREDEGEVSIGCLLRKLAIVNNQAGTHACLDPVQPPTVTLSATNHKFLRFFFIYQHAFNFFQVNFFLWL